MQDRYGRNITYLRLSVTDLCNLRCAYCMPEDGVRKLRHEDILSIEEIEEIAKASTSLGITKVRITGGEPLVRRGIIEICKRISAISEIKEVCMTTNAALLPRFAEELRSAGVRRLNISLDSLDPETYRMLTRGGELSDALHGIEIARETGFDNIKINVVLMQGINDGELRKLAELSLTKGTNVRFIELMPVGFNSSWTHGKYLSCDVVLAEMPELEPLESEGVARLFRLPNANSTVGLISAVSAMFCSSCDRVRITSDGKLKPCLHSPDEINLRGLHGDELIETMRLAIYNKPPNHTLNGLDGSASLRNMNAIGG